jgi:hypothetical protein
LNKNDGSESQLFFLGCGYIMLDINFNQIVEMIEKRKNNAYKKVNG